MCDWSVVLFYLCSTQLQDLTEAIPLFGLILSHVNAKIQSQAAHDLNDLLGIPSNLCRGDFLHRT